MGRGTSARKGESVKRMKRQRKAWVEVLALCLCLALLAVGGTGCRKSDPEDKQAGAVTDQDTSKDDMKNGGAAANSADSGTKTDGRGNQDENGANSASKTADASCFDTEQGQSAENQVTFDASETSGSQTSGSGTETSDNQTTGSGTETSDDQTTGSVAETSDNQMPGSGTGMSGSGTETSDDQTTGSRTGTSGSGTGSSDTQTPSESQDPEESKWTGYYLGD